MKQPFAWSDTWNDVFRRICASRWGFYYKPDDPFTLRHTIERAYQASAAGSIEAFAALLEDLPDTAPDVQAFIAQMVVGETSFFRNRAQFAALAEYVLPELVHARRSSGHLSLNAWSAGCASGEEPYSIAILLTLLLDDWRDWRIRIHATDINPFALRRAKDALYSDWSFREVEPEIVATYFTRVSKLRKLTHPCKELVTFRRQNLATDRIPDAAHGLSNLDLIFCRNVTIYFDRALTARVVGSLFDALAPGGWLVVGHTEPDTVLFSRFESHEFPDTILYRRPEAALARAMPRPAAPAPAVAPPIPRRPTGPLPRQTAPTLEDAVTAYEANDLSAAYELLFVVANRETSDPVAPHLLAQISADAQRYDEALFWSYTALQRDTFHVPTLLLMGLVHLERGEPARAKEQFQHAIFNEPTSPEAHLYLSLAYQTLGHDELAERSRDRAVRLARDAPAPAGALLPVQRARFSIGARSG